MPITPQQERELQVRLDKNRRPKCATINEMDTFKNDGVIVATAPRFDACSLGREIEDLHKPFIQYCNLKGILYVNSRPDKKTSQKCGTFDFVCMKDGCGIAIEFKALENPESGLSQAQKDWRDWAERCGVPCLVTNSLTAAIKFATVHLEIKL